jgi:hypothetical protein
MSIDHTRDGDIAAITDTAARVLAGVRTAVVGMDEPLTLALATILAGGHVLFEDVPGLGKTLAARSLAAALGLEFRRLQCTPDMLPGDVTGSFVYAPDSGSSGSARSDLHRLAARGRDQSHHPEDPVRDAGGDGGAPGHGRGTAVRPARAVPCDRDLQPHRVRGHIRAARSATGPVHGPPRRRVSGARERGRIVEQRIRRQRSTPKWTP